MQQDLMPGLGLARGGMRGEHQIKIHGPAAFEGMRQAGQLAAVTLDFITPHVRAGVTTGELDRLCHEFIVGHDAIPAPLNYRGFPKSICTSINHVVCHGIPGDHIGAIGDAIQRYAESHRYSVVRDFCGHGVGRVFHDAPSILHYGRPEDGVAMREGMFFTVEPMINAGRYEVKVLSDGWTAVTKDRSLSAQFEHTVGVTATGYEIFTISPAGLHRPPYDLSLLAENPRPGPDRP